MTTMGFQADDPNDPAEVGKAAKRSFSDGSSGNCLGQSVPKCSPIFTVKYVRGKKSSKILGYIFADFEQIVFFLFMICKVPFHLTLGRL